jgi:flagellar motor switch/type III secretory pathway protein FliN
MAFIPFRARAGSPTAASSRPVRRTLSTITHDPVRTALRNSAGFMQGTAQPQAVLCTAIWSCLRQDERISPPPLWNGRFVSADATAAIAVAARQDLAWETALGVFLDRVPQDVLDALVGNWMAHWWNAAVGPGWTWHPLTDPPNAWLPHAHLTLVDAASATAMTSSLSYSNAAAARRWWSDTHRFLQWTALPRQPVSFAVPWAVVIGKPRARMSALRALQPGDVIPWQARSTSHAVSIAVGNPLRQIAHGKIDGLSVRISSLVTPSPSSYSGADFMTQQNPDSQQDGANEDPAWWRDTHVTLQVVAGHGRCTLSDLAQLSAGDVLRLDRDASEDTVEVYLADHRIARGRLVSLEGWLGVQIETLEKSGSVLQRSPASNAEPQTS